MAGGCAGCIASIRRSDDAALVGDEALLLAGCAPAWVAADRAAGARAAVAAGAGVLVMDDGLQNPGLAKDFSLLVIDGATGFGNGRVIPAGPLREPVAAAAARCAAAVLIGEDRTGARDALPPGLPVLGARLEQQGIADLAGRRVLAFAGIGIPEKFFAGLRAAGAVLAGTAAFPDHHPYTAAELRRVLARAAAAGALAVTTPKDAVRLPADLRARVCVAGVRLVWEEPAALDALLAGVLGSAAMTRRRLAFDDPSRRGAAGPWRVGGAARARPGPRLQCSPARWRADRPAAAGVPRGRHQPAPRPAGAGRGGAPAGHPRRVGQSRPHRRANCRMSATLGPYGRGAGLGDGGRRVLRACRDAGGPVMLFSGHIGGWEMLPAHAGRHTACRWRASTAPPATPRSMR